MSSNSFNHGTSINITQLSQDNIMKFYFVKKDTEMTEAMIVSQQELKERLPDPKCIHVVSQEQCLNIPKAQLKEHKHIFVFDKFDQNNEAFSYIFKASTVYILGTRCLTTMVLENISTPSDLYHLHNLAMRKLIICTSGLTKERRKEIIQLVSFMGGHYSDALREVVTHLVSDNVRSVKYETAVKNNIKVYHPDWVKDVWQKSQNQAINVVATAEQFDCFKLPVFFNLCVTSTGLKIPERNQIKTVVEENGGRYSMSFNATIDILIMEEDSIGSQKHNAAKKMKKICLRSAWIYESIEIGYLLPYESYEHKDPQGMSILKMKASTPTKLSYVSISKFNPDNTQLSDVSRLSSFARDISLSETRNSSVRPTTSLDYKKIMSLIKLPLAKKAGNVLDGMSFHLVGFSNDENQLLWKVLSILGGTKMDEINDQVTHIIVGVLDPKLLGELENQNVDPMVVKVDWLLKVIEEKKFVEEKEFVIERTVTKKVQPEKPSPASKRAMTSLSSTFKRPEIPKLQLEARRKDDAEEQALLGQYLENPPPEDDSRNFTDCVKFLMGKYVFVHGFCDSSSGATVVEECERLGAALVDSSFAQEVDYVIAPSEILPEIRHNVKSKHVVSDRWLEDSANENQCVEVQFYHRPLVQMKSHERPLIGENFVVSNYKGSERDFIKMLVHELGGVCGEVLRKNESAIVISPDNKGNKFASAEKWDFAVLPVKWLLDCYDSKTRVDETKYLIGGTKASTKNKSTRRESVVPSSQDPSSQAHFDVNDPPIENFMDDDDIRAGPSETTPTGALRNRNFDSPQLQTPLQLNISRLTKDMSTPRRNLVNRVLLEGKKKAEESVSPRKKRLDALINTPTSKAEHRSFPPAEMPACMKPPLKDYSLRPNSSPDSQWFHKRKFESLEQNFIERPRTKKLRQEANENESLIFSHRRYDFFKDLDPENRSEASKLQENSKPLNKTVHTTGTEVEEDAFQELNKLNTNEKDKNQGGHVRIADDIATQRNTEEYPDSEMLVEWKDPVEDERSLSRGSSSSFSCHGFTGKKFTISIINDDMKRETSRRITSLGGTIVETNFTHLLTMKPNSGEKYLMALASGAKVLHLDYVAKCFESSAAVDSAPYEFGNPKFMKSLAIDFDSESVVFKAPYSWRRWIAQDREKFRDGAFTDLNFIVAASDVKKQQFSKIIKAGGGTVHDIDYKRTFNLAELKRGNISYILQENTQSLKNTNKEILKTAKVEVVNTKALFRYLTSETIPYGLE